MSRKTAREDVFKLIFSSSLNKEEKTLENYFEELDRGCEHYASDITKKDREYIKTVYCGVLQNKEEIEGKISENLKGWKLSRLSRVSVAVLKIALYEMLYMDDVPSSVTINEAVNIAKKFEDEKAGAFVNGVLGTLEKAR